MFNWLLKPSFLFKSLFILFSAAVFLYRLDAIPMVLYDEPLYAKVGYEFFSNGHLSPGVFAGREFFLYTFLLGIWLKFFPITLEGFRSCSVFLGLASLFVGMDIGRKLRFPLFLQLGLGYFILFCNTSFVGFRIIRPEALSVLLCVVFIWQLISVFEKESPFRLMVLGFIVSLLGLTHLIAAIFGFLAILLVGLRLQKKVNFFWIVLGTLPQFILFFVNLFVFLQYTPDSFLNFLKGSERFVFHEKLLTLFQLNWHLFWFGYCLTWKRALLVLLEFFIIFLSMFQFRRHPLFFILSFSALGSVILMNSFVNVLRPYYMLFPVIVGVLMSLLVFLNFRFLKIVFFTLIFIHSLGDGLFLYLNKHNTSFAAIENQISPLLLKKDILFGDTIFWFLAPHHNWSLNGFDEIHSHQPIKLIFCHFKTFSKLTSIRFPVDSEDLALSQDLYSIYGNFLSKNAHTLLFHTHNSYGNLSLYEVNPGSISD